MKKSYLVILLIFVSCSNSALNEQEGIEEVKVENVDKLYYVKINNSNSVDTICVNQINEFNIEYLVETVNSIVLSDSYPFTTKDIVDTVFLDNELMKYTIENSLMSYFIFYHRKYGIIYGHRFFGVNETFERLVRTGLDENIDSLNTFINKSKEECIIRPIEGNVLNGTFDKK